MSNEVSNDFFEHGASFIVTKDDYLNYYKTVDGVLGPGGERFVTPTNQMDKLLIVADGNVNVIEIGLGKNPGDWLGQDLVRVDVDKSVVAELYANGKFTLPTGNEFGANNNFELEPVRIKMASKIMAKVRFPKYIKSSLS